jgi:hypothetical protein
VKLGFNVSERSVARYLRRLPRRFNAESGTIPWERTLDGPISMGPDQSIVVNIIVIIVTRGCVDDHPGVQDDVSEANAAYA